MLSPPASSLFDRKQVFICWIHWRLKSFLSNLHLLQFLLLFLLLLLRIGVWRPVPPAGRVPFRAAVWRSRSNSVRFLHLRLFPLLHLPGFSLEASSRKVASFIQEEFHWYLPRGGHWSLGFPCFAAARAFVFAFIWGPVFVIAVEKDVIAAVFVAIGCVARWVVVSVMADFVLLLRWFWSDGRLSAAGENSVPL